MARRGARALQIIPRHLVTPRDVLRGTGPQGACQGRRRGTARPPQGPLHRTIGPQGAMMQRDGLGATQYPAQDIEQFVDGAIADGLVRHLPLVPQRGQATVPEASSASGTQTGTPCGHRRLLVHGALLSAQGHFLS
jgi:hypothetical protein